MEQNSELVDIGKLISTTTYERKKHEIHLTNDEFYIALDFFDTKSKTIHEVKKSRKMEFSHIWQVKFYIYVLTKMGFKDVTGEIDYPLLRKKIKIKLEYNDIPKLEQTIAEIKKTLNQSCPPPKINKPFCRSCSYFELCYI